MPKADARNKPGDEKMLNRRLQQALRQQRNGNLAAARRKCRKILQKAPDHGEALQLLAILMQQSGNTRSALHFMQKALKTAPKNPLLLKNLAEIHRAGGDFEKAQHYVQAALAIAPDNTDALFVSAAVYLQQGSRQQAIEQFARLVAIDPADAEAHNELGNLMCARGELRPAIRHYRQALDSRPGFDDCRINLADTLLQAGNAAAAIEQYQRVLAREPHNANIHCRLGRVYLDLGEAEKAIGSFELALELNPLLLEARLAMGKILLEADHHQAENWFKSVLDIDPKNVEGYYWLGILFQSIGKFERASNYLQQASRIDPEFVPAWYRLSLDRNFEPSRQQVQMLARQNARLTYESDDIGNRVSLGFTLGRFYEQQGDHVSAFSHFRQANELRARRHPFDRDLHAAQIDKVIATFDAAFFGQRAGWGIASETPVFVIGMPRSGTTLVEKILAAHPAIHGAGELPSMLNLVESLDTDGNAGDGSHAARIAGLDRERVDRLARRLLEQMQSLAPAATRIVDKLPGNYFRLGLIRLLLPRAKIIHCRRDPMDTCWSCYQQNFESGLNFSSDLENLGHAYRGYRKLMAHWHRVFPDQIFDLCYEDLVRDTEPVCRKLLEYCGVGWQPEVLEHQQYDHPVNTASIWQARQPIYQSSIGRWKAYRRFLQPLGRLIGDGD